MIHPIEQFAINAVTDLRKQRNLKQSDLAEVLNTVPSFISNVEISSHPAKYNLAHLHSLSSFFRVSPRDFLPDKAVGVNSESEL